MNSFEVFVNSLNEALRKIEIPIVQTSDISEVLKDIIIEEVILFKGTMQVHQVVQIIQKNQEKEPVVLHMKSMSCFKCNPVCAHYSLGTIIMYKPEEHENITSCDEQQNEHNINIPSCSLQEPGDSSYKSWHNIRNGSFVLVKFNSKITEYLYVCIVLGKDDEDGEITVQGLQMFDKKGYEFVRKEGNECIVEFDSILEILPDPSIVWKQRLLVYKFLKPVQVYEAP